MAKKLKTKRKAKKKVAKSKKRATPARRKKVAARKLKAKAKPKTKSAKPKRRAAKTKLPPRGKAPGASRPMTQPGPAVTALQPRPSPFPSSVPGDFPTRSPDGKD
jgi:hypothetical protein